RCLDLGWRAQVTPAPAAALALARSVLVVTPRARHLRLLDRRLVVRRPDLEVLDVERTARLDDDPLLQALLHLLEERPIGRRQHLRDVGMNLDHHGVAL